jgi:zinc transport system substrate-binding protein
MFCLIFIVVGGCITKTENSGGYSSGKELTALAGIQPIAYLVERIGGEHVEARVLLPPGQDPHTFELTPRQVAALGASKLFFQAGMPFENLMVERIKENPHGPEIVDVAEGIAKRSMDADSPANDRAIDKGTVPFSSDENRDSSPLAIRDSPPGVHAGRGDETLDPHVWLSPTLLKIMADNVAKSLKLADPTHEQDYQQNLASLLKDIDATREEVQKILDPLRGRWFLVYHPAFGYFADAFGLKQLAVEAGGKPPTPKQLQTLIEKAKADNVQAIFVQPQFDPRSAQIIADAIGGKVVPLDDLAEDVLANLKDMAIKIEQNQPETIKVTP